MKSTPEMRARIRDLMTSPQDDYDRAVECVLDDLDELIASHHSISERTYYDPTIQPYDDPLRHVERPSVGVEQMQRDIEQLRGMLEIERRINSEHAAISVLPLEWKEHEGTFDEVSYWADHQFGSYAIERDYFSVMSWELVAGGRVIGHFNSVEAAQSAAQENFEQRVRSCLTSIRTKGAADEIERLRAALLPFAPGASMTQITDPYAELGVDRDAGSDEINRAYRAQARKHHPDKGGDRDKFDRIGTAVAILRDPDKRAKFDRTGAVDDRAEQDQRTQAFALINGHLGAIVNEYISSQFDPSKNPEALDVVSIVRHMIRLEVEQARQNSHIGHKHVALLERMKRRLKRKKKAKGSDLISAAMDHQIANSRRQLEALTETIELRNCALELLDDYTFEAEAPSTAGYSVGTWHFFNNGSGM